MSTDRNARMTLAIVSGLLILACGGDPTSPDRSMCGPYPEQTTSEYALPYPVGTEYLVGQGNCSDGPHGSDGLYGYSYDFVMSIGTPIAAARPGRVTQVVERHDDDDRNYFQANYIIIEHADGTHAAYSHLTHDGALAEVGDTVRRGQVIALSGNSGFSTQPHLHFHVRACDGCDTIPIVFRNTRPHPMGLQQVQSYRAEPWE